MYPRVCETFVYRYTLYIGHPLNKRAKDMSMHKHVESNAQNKIIYETFNIFFITMRFYTLAPGNLKWFRTVA